MTTKLMAGIDLHSNNLFCAIVDMDGQRVFEKKLPCDLPGVLAALKPFKKRLKTIAVEATYNWYWLVDGLQDHGYPVVLANPAAMQQYDGLKHADDKSDGFFLAEMLRLNILPTGHLCDRAVRPVRDLLRRRMGLVQKRTSLILSLKSLPIWLGPLWKRPTSRSATMQPAGGSTTAKRPRSTASWPPRRWPASWPRPPGTR